MATHKCAWCPASYSTAVEVNRHQMGCPYTPDPRDAEIARLKAEADTRVQLMADTVDRFQVRAEKAEADLAAHKRALAAGPAALRVMSRDYEDNVVANTLLVPDARERGLRRCSDLISDARIVEAAQEVAMKGGG